MRKFENFYTTDKLFSSINNRNKNNDNENQNEEIA